MSVADASIRRRASAQLRLCQTTAWCHQLIVRACAHLIKLGSFSNQEVLTNYFSEAIEFALKHCANPVRVNK